MAIKQLRFPVWFHTPKGIGVAHFLIDYGCEADLIFVCIIDETGEIWSFPNTELRAVMNMSLGAKRDENKAS